MTLKVTVRGPVEDEKSGTICIVDVFCPDQDPKSTWSGESWMIKTDDVFEALKSFSTHWLDNDSKSCRRV